MNNPQIEPKLTAVPEIPKEFGDDGGHFYRYYDALADELDDDMVKSLKAQLDGILIFAGLFAGVNSAFLALTLPEMSADPADDTNALLLQLVTGGNGSIRSPEDLPSASFTPSPAIFPVNLLFSLSLTLALVSSFLAVIGQQWLVYYRKRSGGGSEHQRWEQLRRYLGAKRWRLEAILDDILPGLLQLALVIFCIGFVAYLRTLSKTMCYVIAGPMAIAGAILLLMGFAGAWYPWCPFKSPLSRLLQLTGNVFRRHKALRYLLGLLFFTIYKSSISFLYLMAASKSLARNIKRLVTPLIDYIFCRNRRDLAFLPLGKELWWSCVALVHRALFGSGERTDYLKVIAAKRVLCTSEDFNALTYTAINLHAMTSPNAIECFLDDESVYKRLEELCIPSQGLLAGTLSRAFIRLVFVGHPAELLAEPRYRRSPYTKGVPQALDLVSKFDTLSERLSKLSKCIALAIELPHTHWNDSLELVFYCKLLGALLHRDPTTGVTDRLSPSLDDVIGNFYALEHCPLRLVGLVAHMRYSVNKSPQFQLELDQPVPPGEPVEPPTHWNGSEAQNYGARLDLVRKFINVSHGYKEYDLDWGFEGCWSQDPSEDNFLGLIEGAFCTRLNRPGERFGMTYIWLLEQLLVISTQRRSQSGWDVLLRHSVDLLYDFGLHDVPLTLQYRSQRYRRCTNTLSRCLQAMRRHYGEFLSFEGNGPVLHKLVDCLESPTTHDIFSSDDLAMLSSWLEMRDAFRDPSGWANPIVDKYKEIYPRIKAAFDKIESKMPGYQDTRHVKQNLSDPPLALTNHGRVHQPELLGSGIIEHVEKVSQEAELAEITRRHSGGSQGNEDAVMAGSVPEGATGDQHQQEQLDPSSEPEK